MPERKVILVGWDGADWKIARPLLEAGQLPQLALAVKNGASGPAESLPPYLSPMLWNSMATGKRPHRHGILGFTQVNPSNGRVQPVSSRMRRCPAFWNILSARKVPNHVVGWFASHPAEKIHGVCVSEAYTRPPEKCGQPWPIPRHAVFPPEWADRLGETRVRSEDVDQALLRLFLPVLDEMPVDRDRHWEKIIYRLAELYTAHNAAITLLASDPSWRCLAVYYHFIDWICHDFMEYRPPRMAGVTEQQVRFYGSVVDAAYRVQDFLLTDLLQHAGSDVTLMLVSDHGFHSDHLRPTKTPAVTAGIANWHRPHGMMVLSGPGIKQGEVIEGANILDVAPTLLHLLDVPVGKDMDGRALFEITTEEKPPATVPSWEAAIRSWREEAGEAGAEDDDALLQQFIDLGYIEMPSNPDEDLVEMTERETAFNLGISLLDANLPAQALPHLWQAHALAPEVPHYAFHLARALADLRFGDAAMQVLEVLRDFGEDNPESRVLRARITYSLGDIQAAAEHLEVAAARLDQKLGFESQKGLIALHQNRLEAAESCFRKVLEQDAEDPVAWACLARALLRRGNYEEASASARKALALKREIPLAHLTVAQACEALGDPENAALAYAQALRLEPSLMNSREGLLRLHPTVTPEMQQRVLSHLARTRADKPTGPWQAQSGHANEIWQQVLSDYRKQTTARRALESPVEVYHCKAAAAPASSGKEFWIVSGMPRSGTSMLMQMLAEGGMELMTDGIRKPDTNNPKGYCEWEVIKRLAEQPDVIEQAGERPFKVISAQLRHLPREHAYRVVFMRRPVVEVARSQQAMLDRLGKTGGGQDLEASAAALASHEQAVLAQLRARPEVKVLELNYHASIEDPAKTAALLRDFFGAERLAAPEIMIRAVDPTLHRQRAHA